MGTGKTTLARGLIRAAAAAAGEGEGEVQVTSPSYLLDNRWVGVPWGRVREVWERGGGGKGKVGVGLLILFVFIKSNTKFFKQLRGIRPGGGAALHVRLFLWFI